MGSAGFGATLPRHAPAAHTTQRSILPACPGTGKAGGWRARAAAARNVIAHIFVSYGSASDTVFRTPRSTHTFPPTSPSTHPPPQTESTKQSMQDMAEKAKQTASDAAEKVKDAAGYAKEQTQDKATEMRASTEEKAAKTRQEVRKQM